MLDRLMCGTIFAQANRIMRHHIDSWNAHQSREAHGAAGVIGEAHKRAAVGANPAMQRHTVHCSGHAMLADPVVNVATGAIFGIKNPHIRGFCIVRPGQIS